jgi:predicted GNAT family N-acyltransferase
MFTVFTQMKLHSLWQRLVRLTTTADSAEGRGDDVAHRLMESSQARGLNRFQAQELRLAARAYLSVVR